MYSLMPNSDVVFVDRDMFVREKFTSGLLIEFREKLVRMQNLGLKVSILSISNRLDNFHKISKYKIDNIDVYEVIVDYDIHKCNFENTKIILEKALYVINPTLILTYMPAVFLSKMDIIYAKTINENCNQVVYVLADQLYPSYKNNNKKLVNKFFKIIKNNEIQAVSKTIQNNFFRESSILADQYNSLWNLKKILVKNEIEVEKKFITLVNIHPIKGLDIFLHLADLMPSYNFLCIKTWVDVDNMLISKPNLRVIDFVENASYIYEVSKYIIVPSLIEEGAARVVIESMLNQVPVFAHRIGSLPEIIPFDRFLITPPKILGYSMVGSIMKPIVSKDEIHITALKFKNKIVEYESKKNILKINKLSLFAWDYIIEGENKFKNDCIRWFSSNN